MICFGSDRERSAFGKALALARARHFELGDLRDELTAEISTWEADHPDDSSDWNYYERFLTALERTVAQARLLPAEETVPDTSWEGTEI